MRVRLVHAALALGALAASPATAASGPAAPHTSSAARTETWKALPDWSGVWQMIGNTVFDRSTQDPQTGGAGTPGVREHPPYNPEWEAKYQRNIDLVKVNGMPDPLSYCGTLSGIPRMYNHPDGYEWAITPTRVWMLGENGPQRRVIYTDGRPHKTFKAAPNTHTGDAIGHWEGDTLVVDTVGLPDNALLDRTGAILSDKAHVVERVRKIDPDTLEAQLVVEDPGALTKPWRVVKRFRKLPKNSYVFDYVCAENNRNPIDAEGHTQVKDVAGKVIAQ